MSENEGIQTLRFIRHRSISLDTASLSETARTVPALGLMREQLMDSPKHPATFQVASPGKKKNFLAKIVLVQIGFYI